jgi:hypothetical protein
MCGIIPYKDVNIDTLSDLARRLSNIAHIQYNRFYVAFSNSGMSGALYWEDNPEFTPEQNKLGAAIVDLNMALAVLGNISYLPIPGAKDFDFKNGTKDLKRFSEQKCPCCQKEK